MTVDEIALRPILFRVPMMRFAFNGREWPVVGNRPLEEDLQQPAEFLAIRTHQNTRGKIYAITMTSKEYLVSYERAKDLELLSVYEPIHVAQRLELHARGETDPTVELLKLDPNEYAPKNRTSTKTHLSKRCEIQDFKSVQRAYCGFVFPTMNAYPVLDLVRSPHARLRPVPVGAVTLRDAFWEPRRRLNREETLGSQFQKLEESGVLNNFRRAAGTFDGEFEGYVFTDSDAYKWLEAAATTLGTHPTPELQEMVDTVIALIEAAQDEDGYLNTYYVLDRKGQRWTNLRDQHEMYCIGHLLQAVVAHFRATGSRRLLDVGVKVADNLCDTFGPIEEGKRLGTCGHPEIEMGLVELFRATGERRYLDEAAFLVAMRGHNPSVCYASPDELRPPSSAYHQDHVPYRELADVTGHAVRMLYLAAGAADLVLETGDEGLRAAMDAQWHNMTTRRMYVSGGLGARYEGEAFGKDFELPNDRAYTETCAAIASVMWNARLLALSAEARYADLLEHTLYNAVLPGLSLDGRHYYYQNPLEDDGTHRRRAWFGCACCPPNVARMLAQLPGYFASTSAQNVWLHLYAQGTISAELPDGQTVELEVATNYPWDGDVRIEIKSTGHFGLNLRVPAWCEEGATLSVNGQEPNEPLAPNSYSETFRDWQVGDTLHLHLPMPVLRLASHPYVSSNEGRVALQRGPLLYAIESADFPDTDLRDLVLPPDVELTPTQCPDLLGGVITLDGKVQMRPLDRSWQNTLYHTTNPTPKPPLREVECRAIPYYAWANRSAGQMQVWLRTD